MKKYQVIIFDYDGVLVDSNTFHFQALQKTASEYNLPFTPQDHQQYFVGSSLIDGARQYLKAQQSEDKFDQFIQAKKQYDIHYKEVIEPIPGSLKFIQQVNHSHQLAVCSGSRKNLVQDYLKKFNLTQTFASIVTTEDVNFSKPNPESYLLVLKSLSISASQILAIEDSPSGIQSAIRAGIDVIGITTTHSKRVLSDSTFIVHDFDSIQNIIHL